jgi:hypothetical protein
MSFHRLTDLGHGWPRQWRCMVLPVTYTDVKSGMPCVQRSQASDIYSAQWKMNGSQYKLRPWVTREDEASTNRNMPIQFVQPHVNWNVHSNFNSPNGYPNNKREFSHCSIVPKTHCVYISTPFCDVHAQCNAMQRMHGAMQSLYIKEISQMILDAKLDIRRQTTWLKLLL